MLFQFAHCTFKIASYKKNYSSPFRLGRYGNDGSTLLYIRKDIPLKLLSIEKNRSIFCGNKLTWEKVTD